MKMYVGKRVKWGCMVEVDGKPLPARLDLMNHSPTGFEWGYGGSGPAQLALAILADYLGDDQKALDLYQDFKQAAVANLPHKKWILTGEEITRALDEQREEI